MYTRFLIGIDCNFILTKKVNKIFSSKMIISIHIDSQFNYFILSECVFKSTNNYKKIKLFILKE